MSILNVNQIQPVGGGNTITVNASDVSASGVTITASSFVGPVTGNVTGNVTSSSTSTFSSGINVTSGNVGVGTDGPGSLVDIASGDLEFSNKANSSAIQTINFSDGTQGRGKIQYLHDGDNLTFHTFSDERIRINSNGDLGVNTTGGTYTVQMHEPSTGSFTLQLTTGAIGAASTSGARITASSSRKLFIENQENEDTLFYNNGGEKVVIKAGGNLEISNGDLVVANGHGIDFSATGNATGMTNELLDDYEEGTYTVVMSDTGSGTITASTSDDQAQYTKIGNLVTVSGRPLVGSKSSPTGDLRISLPFVPAALAEAAERSPASLYIRLCESGSNVNNFQAALSSTASLQFGYASGTDHVASGNRVKAGTQIWFSVTYRVA